MKKHSALAAGLILATFGAGDALASSPATVRVQPKTVRIGGKALIAGSHLRPGKFYTFLVAVPNGAKPKARSFIHALAKADKQGSLRVQFVMPVVTVCGKATLYATAAGSPVSTSTTFTLTGCRASGSGSAPPPPPPGHKSKH